MIKLNGVEIKLDKYPDGTFLFKDIPPIGGWCRDNIEWFFESMEELTAYGKHKGELMEEADMTPGRPQQLPYVSPPDKKMSQEKSGSNIVVEWMSAIKEIAENGYALSSANIHSKDEKFQRIIGMCNAVIMVLKEN